MVYCCAFGCNNRSDRNKRKDGVGFHRFPKDEKLRKEWVQAIRRKNFEPSAHSVVCTEHFSDKHVIRTYLSGPKLRENGVPTVFPAYPDYLKKDDKLRNSPAHWTIGQKTINCQENDKECHSVQLNKNQAELDLPTLELPHKNMAVQVDDIDAIREIEGLRTQNKRLSWRVSRLTDRLRKKSRVLKTVRKRNSRLTNRIKSLNSLINLLKSKKLVSEESAFLLKNMQGARKELFPRSMKHAKKEDTPDLRALDLTCTKPIISKVVVTL